MNISTDPRCRVCKEPIAKGAIKCRHCKSFQNYFRYISMLTEGQAFFALVFSFISLFTSFYSLINSIQIPNDHEIDVHFNDVSGGVEGQTTKALSFYVWKKGREPASIRKIWLIYKIQGKSQEFKIDLYADSKSLLGLLEHDTKGEIFLRIVDSKKLKFSQIEKIQKNQLFCKIEMTSFGLEEGVEKEIRLKREEIKSENCYNFLISHRQ